MSGTSNPQNGYLVTLLHEGASSVSADGSNVMRCNTVLLHGPAGRLIINPGSVWNQSELMTHLKSAGVQQPGSDINFVVCTDGRAHHVGCLSLFDGAEMVIVGYDIQRRPDTFVAHDFGDGVAPYEFDDFLYVVGTPGQRDHQVSLIVRGWLSDDPNAMHSDPVRIAITGNLFASEADASHLSCFDMLEGNRADGLADKENSLFCWRRSRQYIFDRADWIIPACGPAFKIKPEYSSTPCVELV